ncbi:MAG: hypothetical protein GTO18_12785 [Anaerolineales bacterium]|nr:hypothetical protein [Anaerolineales bacterium]
MLSYRDFTKVFKDLDLGSSSQVIVHANVDALGDIAGGANTIVGALLATCGSIITPTFTNRTMVIPPYGPENNALVYGEIPDQGEFGKMFRSNMTSDPELGEVAEIIRKHPQAIRSNHPLLSFAGIGAEEALATQSLEDPWGPIKWLADADGGVLLLGADQRMNVSIHAAEFLAGRKLFLRWAMSGGKVVEVPHWPGCAEGFQSIGQHLHGVARTKELGRSFAEIIPLRDLINIVTGWIREDEEALLCERPECEYCIAMRAVENASKRSNSAA